jgi:hypothetical protein
VIGRLTHWNTSRDVETAVGSGKDMERACELCEHHVSYVKIPDAEYRPSLTADGGRSRSSQTAVICRRSTQSIWGLTGDKMLTGRTR